MEKQLYLRYKISRLSMRKTDRQTRLASRFISDIIFTATIIIVVWVASSTGAAVGPAGMAWTTTGRGMIWVKKVESIEMTISASTGMPPVSWWGDKEGGNWMERS